MQPPFPFPYIDDVAEEEHTRSLHNKDEIL